MSEKIQPNKNINRNIFNSKKLKNKEKKQKKLRRKL